MRVSAVVCLGLCAAACSLFAQKPGAVTSPAPAASPTTKSIAPSAQGVSAGMMYHRVYVISPLMGSGKPGDPKRPIFAPAPPQPPVQGATIARATPPSGHSGLLGYQMQLSDDGQTALVEMVFSDPISFQAVMQQEAANRSVSVPAIPATAAAVSPAAVSTSLTTALQGAVPGLQIFERGKATDAQILSAFQKYKANFSFNGTTVRPQ
jgi:hypothetical protein